MPANRRTSSSRSVRRTRWPPASTRFVRASRCRRRHVTSELGIDITGQPKVELAGREGCSSARASAGSETPSGRRHQHRHGAGRTDVELSGSGPSGWKVEFNPKTDRPHPAEREEGGAGADHADGQGDRRRLCDDGPCLGARRVGIRRPSGSRCRPRRYGASSASASSASRSW